MECDVLRFEAEMGIKIVKGVRVEVPLAEHTHSEAVANQTVSGTESELQHSVSEEYTLDELAGMEQRDLAHIEKLCKTKALKATIREVERDLSKNDPYYVDKLLSCVDDWGGKAPLVLMFTSRKAKTLAEYPNLQIIVKKDEWERFKRENSSLPDVTGDAVTTGDLPTEKTPEYKHTLGEVWTDKIIKKKSRRKKLPPGPGRKQAEFTRVIDSLFFQLIDEKRTEFLRPKRTEEFLDRLKERATESKDTTSPESKLKDSEQTYCELIDTVRPKNPTVAVLMRNPRLVRGEGKKIQAYTRKDVDRRLYELRKEHPEIL